MPGDAKDCRARARRCAELAAQTDDWKLKQTFAELVRSWERLATDLERAEALQAELAKREPRGSI
jgi:hypothetical protein